MFPPCALFGSGKVVRAAKFGYDVKRLRAAQGFRDVSTGSKVFRMYTGFQVKA